jgi:lipopolysaccharide export system ATP-binding protein
MVVGLVRADAGEITIDGAAVQGKPIHQRSRLGLSYLPQEASIFRKLTVEENILAILETLDLPRAERGKRLEELLRELGIAHLRKSKALTLSGGERRRLEITRALVTHPLCILLDEPFSGIDPIAVSDCQNLIRELKQKGLGILLTDHNVRETLAITDRAYIMSEGKILISGTKDELLTNRDARKIYLGEKFTM